MSEKVKQKRDEKKLAMIASFIEVFSRQGLDGTFMRRLASSAGVSEGLLYRYFEDKDDIIRQCTVHYHEQIQKELTALFAAYLHKPNQMPDRLLEYVDSVLDICRFLLQVMAHPTYSSMMEDTGKRVNAHILNVAGLFQEKLSMERDAAVGAAFLLNSIVNDYVLKKSREYFLVQFQAVQQCVWGKQ